MTSTLKSLHLPVKGTYFNQYLAGEKCLEYRKITERWTKLLCNPDGSFKQFKDVHYKFGYPKKGDDSKIIVLPFVGIHVVKGLVHPHFDNVPTDVYAIGLDDISNRLNKPSDQGEVTTVKENKSCGYEGSHFGAAYADATCVNGFLWDLDSIEDGMLTSGGDRACPQCNTEGYLRAAAEELNEGISGNNVTNVPIWSSIVSGCRELNPEGTEAALKAIGKVSIISHFPLSADDAEYEEFVYE